jgi:hypothetical protein
MNFFFAMVFLDQRIHIHTVRHARKNVLAYIMLGFRAFLVLHAAQAEADINRY